MAGVASQQTAVMVLAPQAQTLGQGIDGLGFQEFPDKIWRVLPGRRDSLLKIASHSVAEQLIELDIALLPNELQQREKNILGQRLNR
jgi:hypothetical protein